MKGHEEKKKYPIIYITMFRKTINYFERNVEVLDHIIESLSPNCLHLFNKDNVDTLNMKMTKIHSQVLSHLMIRQCVSTDNNVILFNLEGNTIEFDLQDFCLIAMLNCGEYVF